MARWRNVSGVKQWLFAFVLVLLLGASTSPAASPWSVRAWQTEEGLPENNVTGVAQTPEGYLWIATHGGLARFDGIRFQLQTLPVASVRSNSLIRAMLLGREKTIWVALEAERGLVFGLSDKARMFLRPPMGCRVSSRWSSRKQTDGAIWVGYVDGTACRIFRGKVTRFGAQEGLLGHQRLLAGDRLGWGTLVCEGGATWVSFAVTISKPGSR